MNGQILQGIFIPLWGTILGAACVFILKSTFSQSLQCILTGFAAGVMTAAAVWSLLIPAAEYSAGLGFWAFFPAAFGFWLGIFALYFLDQWIRTMETKGSSISKETFSFKSNLLVLAVAIHNLPEGMAVGVVYAGLLSGEAGITLTSALVLSMGIAIQNFPEGAIISLPMHTAGCSKRKSFLYGVLSGIIEPVGAAVTILMVRYIVPLLPYLLGFAAGAMIYVVVEELLSEMNQENQPGKKAVCFAVGFSLMMILDITL